MEPQGMRAVDSGKAMKIKLDELRAAGMNYLQHENHARKLAMDAQRQGRSLHIEMPPGCTINDLPSLTYALMATKITAGSKVLKDRN